MNIHRSFARRVCLLLILALCWMMALPVSAKPVDLELSYLETAPVYHRADNSAARIGYLPHGTQLTVLQQQGQYYQIDCYDMIGFIHNRFVIVIKGEYYVNCKMNDATAVTFLERPADIVGQLQLRIYASATALVGVPYVAGGTTPRGFDCAGFTQYIYNLLNISIPRTCDGQLGAGLIISKESLRCGDLVLFQRTTSYRGISTHVGIYLGGGKLIHAGGKGITIVDLESDYFVTHYLCARRIISVEDTQPDLPPVIPFLKSK